jgi:hypothetical protein
MKAFNSKRFRLFFKLMLSAGVFYLLDCLVSFKAHPEMPWYESGIYARGPFAVFTVTLLVGAIGYSIFGKDK